MSWRVRRRHKVSLASFLVLLFIVIGQHEGWFTSAGKGIMTSQPGLYSIAHYIDGDTIAVNMNGSVETVRFIGIDTPETHKPNTPVQCYGPAAAAYTQNRIKSAGGHVRLVADSLDTNRDRYNRLLRYVYLPDGTNLDQELVTKGYAFAYVSFPFTKSDTFSAAQANARANNAGLWGNCQPYQEDNGRWQSNNAS
ncbi:MAG TPA: thermonuclease family protein [Candidatus Saccharimonadales bacterium]|nr:thermonuclease family protein [Candidatus Saccharimonadales bacterium]